MIPKIVLGKRSENIFNIYPNQTSGTLNIDIHDFKEVIICDYLDQKVFISKESYIDISALSKAVYTNKLKD